VEDALVQYAVGWLRKRGAKLAQTILAAHESEAGIPLRRNGFDGVTQLTYLRHDLKPLPPLPLSRLRLRFCNYQHADTLQFHDTLLGTYEESLDCPEVNGVRTIEEIIAGHKAQGRHDPSQWYLALEGTRPLGVVLTAHFPDLHAWDVSYVGVVRNARRRGVGRALMYKALDEARAAHALQLTLTVDRRNSPACQLYRALGFHQYDQRDVYLALLRSKAN
jgi:ribosomal protein S18 acetylase RimI-like enzyme